MTMIPMLPESKRLVLEALRSDEYGQAKNALHVPGEGYCCLGVVCEVAIKAGVEVRKAEVLGSDGEVWTLYDGERSLPPDSVMEWAFGPQHAESRLSVLIDSEPDLDDGDDDDTVEVELVELNDSRGWSFEQIADAIERSL